MDKITRDDMELSVLQYYSQHRVDVFPKTAPELNKENFELMVFPQLKEYDAMGIRHIFRLVGMDKLIHEYPEDWWQMFKARWFPSWLVKHFPIRNKQVIARHMFPFCQEVLRREVVKVIIKSEEKNSGQELS